MTTIKLTRYELFQELTKRIPNKNYLKYFMGWTNENIEKLLKYWQEKTKEINPF